MNTVDLFAHLIKSGQHEAAIQGINELVEIVASLEGEIEDLKAAAPRPVEGDGSALPVDTVVIDKNGDAWQHYEANGWEPIGGCCCMHHALPDDGAPYTIVWTPEENTNE
jgi:hypothetical protein